MTTAQDIRNKIQVLEQERASLPLPNLDALESAIQFHSARVHSVDKATAASHVSQLQATLEAKTQGEANHARARAINGELAKLKTDLHWQEEQERANRARAQDTITSAAYAEYIHAQRAVVHAYRRLEQANAVAAAVPGTSRFFPRQGLHLPDVWPMTWLGTLGDYLNSGAKLPWENEQ